MKHNFDNNPYAFKGVEILNLTDETAIDRTFELKWQGDVTIGQFFEVSVPGVGEAPISVSEYKDGVLYMTIRKVGRVTDVIFNKGPGDKLFLRGPYGNGFELSRFGNRPVSVIAGGTGLAPVRGLIERLHSQGNPLEVLVGFKSPSDRLFIETLNRWEKSLKLIQTVDQGGEGWQGQTGLVTLFLPELGIDSDDRSFVVVGPPIMMKFVTLELLKLGVKEDQIVMSFERNMSCGLGKCGHCKIDETYVCLEGPVFAYPKAKQLLD